MKSAIRHPRAIYLALIVALYTSLGAAPSVAQTEAGAVPSPDLPEAKAIVKQFTDITNLSHMATNTSHQSTKGWIELTAFGLEGSFESFRKKPDRSVSQVRFNGIGVIERGFIGPTGWSIHPMEGHRLLQGGEVLSEILQSVPDVLLHPDKFYEKVETVGREKFDGVDCYKVRFIAKPLPGMDSESTLKVRTSHGFFEVESGLMRGRVELIDPPTGAVTIVTVTTEYKPFQDTLLPTIKRQNFQGLEVVSGTESVDFKVLEDSLFEMPLSIKKLHEATLPTATAQKTEEETTKSPVTRPATNRTPTSKTSTRKPSVLFYLIDTCRADRMGIHNAPHFTTPFLNELAKRSVVFENCNSQAPWTKPSMAAILTSRYPSEVGMTRTFASLSSEVVTFPEALESGGWHTAGFSANPLMGGMSNYTQGFKEFVESYDINAADPIRYASGSARKLNESVFKWLDSNDTWPNMLYVHSVDPHEEYEPDPAYMREFSDPEKMHAYRRQWKALLSSRPPVPGNHLTQDNFDRAGVDSASFIAHGKNLYDADILANDTEIGRLWKRLARGDEKAGGSDAWGDDMIVVVTSDHGEEFFEHGGTCHGYGLYQELIHVPLMIFAPGRLPEGLRIDQPVASIDIYPTLLDLLDLEAPADLRGRSLLPLIKDPKSTPATPIYSEQTEDPGGRMLGSGTGLGLSVIEGRWKFILSLRSPQGRKRDRHELFDRIADPKESQNLASDHPELVARLEQQLLDWSASNLGLVTADEVASEDVDAASLEALRQLGYITDENSEEDLVSSGRRLLPGLARAVLEGDRRWNLLALDPNRQAVKPSSAGKTLHGFTILDRERISEAQRDKLSEALWRGLARGRSLTSKEGVSPRLALQAEFRGHTTSLLLSPALEKIHVYVDDLLLSELPCSRSELSEIEDLALKAGVSPEAN